MNNEIENNIVPATPDAPVTPDAMTTPVETASTEEIKEQTTTEAPAEVPTEETPVESAPTEEVSDTPSEVPTDAPAAVETATAPEAITELPTDVAPMEETPAETPAEAPAEAAPVESVPAETPVEAAPVTPEVTSDVTPAATEEKPKKKSKAGIFIIIGLIGIILGGGWFYYEYFMNNDEKLPPEPEEQIIGDTPKEEGIDKTKYTDVKEFKVTVGEEEHIVTYGLIKKQAEEESMYNITMDVYYDTIELDTYDLSGKENTDSIEKYSSLVHDDMVTLLKDKTNDTNYLVIPALVRVNYGDADDYAIEIHPTIYSLDGKKMAVISTSVYADGEIWATDTASKLYIDAFGIGAPVCNYFIENDEIHYIKPTAGNTTTANEMKVSVNAGVVGEEIVAEIAIAADGELRIEDIGLVISAE